MNNHIEQDLTISLLIQKLQSIVANYGDLPVYDWVGEIENEIRFNFFPRIWDSLPLV